MTGAEWYVKDLCGSGSLSRCAAPALYHAESQPARHSHMARQPRHFERPTCRLHHQGLLSLHLPRPMCRVTHACCRHFEHNQGHTARNTRKVRASTTIPYKPTGRQGVKYDSRARSDSARDPATVIAPLPLGLCLPPAHPSLRSCNATLLPALSGPVYIPTC